MNYKETIKALDDIKTYIHRAYCTNCGNRERLEIPRGVTVSEYLAMRSCENCGCLTYR